jgi:hypothetical protein
MARIKKTNLIPQNWLVRIHVKDANCAFSIKPEITFMRLVKATSGNAAVKAAATYCNKRMQEYPGTDFIYSTTEVTPYYYPLKQSFNEEKDDRITISKI